MLLNRLAERYGKLPSEVLDRLWWEYDFDVAVMLIAIDEEKNGKRRRAWKRGQMKGPSGRVDERPMSPMQLARRGR